jgi:hypothetical protein
MVEKWGGNSGKTVWGEGGTVSVCVGVCTRASDKACDIYIYIERERERRRERGLGVGEWLLGRGHIWEGTAWLVGSKTFTVLVRALFVLNKHIHEIKGHG